MAGRQMQLEDWLDDLCVRFVINLPQEDLSSVARICFQVEEAQWFYEDFIRPLDPTLPSMSLRTFCLRIFRHCPLLAAFPVENHVQAFEEFIQYKTRIPVRGAILLNHAMDSVVLVKGWKASASWSFPRGKINKDEDDLDCAVREVYEETGLDLRAAGLVPTEARPKYIEIPMRDQHLRLYVIRDVPMDTDFQPRTRKEISKIEWYKLSDLPTLRKKGSQNGGTGTGPGPGHDDSTAQPAHHNKFYMVAPFLVPLKKWILSQKKAADKALSSSLGHPHPHPLASHLPIEEHPIEDDDTAAAAAVKVPAIESLDGATRELQRLLNVQPKPDAPAAPPAENKASALLSLLQPVSAASHPAQLLRPQPPHTPSDLTVAEAGHPRNPHHHTNNMPNAPPDLRQPPPSFALSSNQAASGWTAPPGPIPAAQVYPGLLADYKISIPAPQTSFALGGLLQSQQVPGQTLPQPPQLQPPAVSRQPQVHGQALALLNAFKAGPAPPAPPAPPEPKERQQPPPSGAGRPAEPHFSSPYSQYANLSGAATARAEPKSPGELVGSIVGPARQQQHKSALLDLFKTQASSSPPEEPPAPADPPSANNKPPSTRRKVAFDPSSLPAEKNLLAQLQSAPARKKDKRPAPTHAKANTRSPRTAAKPAPQPTRILQRGQPLEPAPESPDFTHLPLPPQAPSYQADVSQEQKRQLLSLFGVAPQVARPIEAKAAPAPDKGMSQADQSFLLDYLQSVTNPASGR